MILLIGNGSIFYLTKEGRYMIGRHVGDFIIAHSTVSRKHAEITVQNNEAFLQDCNSKYFTKYKGKILKENEKIKLEDGAVIRFGEVEFKVRAGEKYITCSTGVKDNEEELRSIMKELGGEYLKNWNNDCTHLTTSEIMVTLKVIHAIMDNKKIVTPSFWKTYLKNMKENKSPPDPSAFYPPLGEIMIHSKYLDYNPDRKTLLIRKTFAFWKKKRHLGMHEIISKAGGKSIFILSAVKNESDLLRLMENCIVMDPEDSKIKETYASAFEAYEAKGKRIIPIQEIVLAILQCSCEENCNPDFNRADTVFKREIVKPGPSRVVLGETECFQFESEAEQKPKVIPCSVDFISDSNTQQVEDKILTKSEVTHRVRDIELTQDPEVFEKIKVEPGIGDEERRKVVSLFKRPANESLAPPPKKAKEDHSSMKLNPFSVMKSRIIERQSTSMEKNDLDLTNNPFDQIKLRQEKMNEDTQDVTNMLSGANSNNENMKKRKNDDCSDSAISKKRSKIICKKNRKFVEVATIDFSNLNHTISSGTWVDKSIKEEIKPTPINLDEEEQKWCERFNNSVVIVAKDLWRKDRDDSTGSNVTFNTSVKNFKKFRKVPVPKAGHIIKCSKLVFGKSNLGIDYQQSDEEDNRNM